MKKLIYLFLILVLAASTNAQEFDFSKKPEPLPATKFEFPGFTEKTLPNGLKVFIIEDHEQPAINIQLLIKGGNSVEGDKSGLADMTTSLLTKGTGQMSAQDIARKLDGVGAGVSAWASGDNCMVSGSCIVKHLDVMLDVFANVVMQPTFPDDEFDKMVPQYETSIKNAKSSPGTLAGRMARIAIYGEKHPYAQSMTMETLQSMSTDDCKEYYNKWFVPNNATIAVTGDVKPDEIVKILEKYLGKWKEGKTPAIRVPQPEPMTQGVYFVERPSSVQTSLAYTTVTVPFNHKDYEKISMAARLLGGGFAGRLFRTLREKHSFTYSPWGYQTSSKWANRFACGSDVRNEVTDSSLIVIKEQIQNLINEPPTEEEFERVRKYTIGSYLMNFENSDFVAGLIQNADFYGIPLKQVKTYTDRLSKMTRYDMQTIAKEYLAPTKAILIAVGAPEVKDQLAKHGTVFTYNLDLKPMKIEKVSLDAEDVLEKYTKFTGGKAEMEKVNSYEYSGMAMLSAQGQSMNGTYKEIKAKGKKTYEMMDLGVMKTEKWSNGTNVWAKQGGMINEMTGDELKGELERADMFFVQNIIKYGYQCKVTGKQDGKIVMNASKDDTKVTFYFNADDFRLEKVDMPQEGPQGDFILSIEWKDYGKFGNLMLPQTTNITSPYYSISITGSYKIDIPVEDSIFMPAEQKN